MAGLTGINCALRINGSAVCKVRNWSLNIARDALDTTCLGQEWREYVSGLRGATGSATIMYDPLESGTVALLNTVFSAAGSETSSVQFVLSTELSRQLTATAFLTNVSPSVAVGEVTVAEVQFQVTGAIAGQF